MTCRTRAVKLTWKKCGVTSASSARNYKETEIWNICYNTSCCFYVDVSTKIKRQTHFLWSTDQQANVQGGLLITCIYVLKVVCLPCPFWENSVSSEAVDANRSCQSFSLRLICSDLYTSPFKHCLIHPLMWSMITQQITFNKLTPSHARANRWSSRLQLSHLLRVR